MSHSLESRIAGLSYRLNFGMPRSAMFSLSDQKLEVIYHGGDVTAIAQPHTTGWRTLPFLANAHVTGAGVLELADGGVIHCRSGHALCIPAGVTHCGTLKSARGISRWSHVSFLFPGGLDVFSLLECPPIFYGAAAKKLGEINAELAALHKLESNTLAQLAEKQSLGFALLATIARVSSWRSDTERLVMDSQRLAPVFASIRQNLSQRICVEELAQLAYLSAPRFHAVFRQATGMAPYAFVQKQRMKRAQELLLSTDLSISEIAAAVGQHDPFLFSRNFRKQCATSPTEYRKNVRLMKMI